MKQITLVLPQDEIDFIFAALTQQPLPYVRVSPIVSSIATQVQAQLNALPAPAADAVTPA
jgi:hypothetical protein